MPADRSPAPPVPAIGYVRVSMAREEMISPATQRASIEACAAREGFAVIDWVEDLDLSGRNFKRRILGVIERVKGGEAQAIIVWKYSRFGRQRKGNQLYIAELEDAGGRLVSATEDFDTSTATGKFQRGILLEVAAFESDRAAETWAETYGWRVREGLPPFGRPRFGYRRAGRVPDEDDRQRTRHVRGEEERYVPDPECGSAALAAAYRAYIGGDGFHAVAGQLNSGGWLTAYGNRWRSQAVTEVLDSGFGAGMLWLHDPVCPCKSRTRCRRRRYVRGAHDPVISEAEWEAYLARRAQVAPLPPRLRAPRYALTGLVRCGHCRSAMVPSGRSSGGMTLFSCSRARSYGAGCDGRPSLGVNRIEAAVREAAGEWASFLDAAARDRGRAAARQKTDGAVARLEQILAARDAALVKMARDRAADAKAGGILGDSAWRAAAAEARAERDRAAAELEAARRKTALEPGPDALAVMTGLLADWDKFSPAMLNGVLRTVFRRVAVYREAERQRGPEGWWKLMPVRFEVHPAWGTDPWEEPLSPQAEATTE